MSGFAAVVPTRPANSVLGGSATSSAPAFPSSCAAADAAAAAVRGRGDVDGIDSIGVETHHLRIFVLYYNCSNYSGTPDLTINIRKREAFATLIYLFSKIFITSHIWLSTH